MPRHFVRAGLLAVIAGAFSFGLGATAAEQAAPAELILINGKVITVDPRDVVAEAVAITGGRIVAVGTTADVRALAASRRKA